MLEKCIDDPSLNIDDIGEKVREDNLSIVEDEVHHEENLKDQDLDLTMTMEQVERKW